MVVRYGPHPGEIFVFCTVTAITCTSDVLKKSCFEHFRKKARKHHVFFKEVTDCNATLVSNL